MLWGAAMAVGAESFRRNEEQGKAEEPTLDSRAFRENTATSKELYKEAAIVQKQFKVGTWLAGLFIGLVLSLKIIGVMLKRIRTDYEPDKIECVSCGRCLEYCPKGVIK